MAAGRVFLTVCNPFDARKNLTTLIEGFLMGTAGGSGKDLLLVKLANSGAMAEPAEYLFHQVRPLFGDPHALHEEGVLFLSGLFSDVEMAQLYAGADFYLSAALGAGQNLSLLEAMAHGCVPVSVRNTAMADYIDEDDAVVIGEGRYSGLLPRISPELSHLRTDNSFADRFGIAEAVRQALSLDDSARAAKVRSARERIASRYTPERIFAAMSARLSKTRPDLVPVPRPAPPPQPQMHRPRERKGWLRALLG
jgi:glycosyltransferase involved in cell wall biosynthesis